MIPCRYYGGMQGMGAASDVERARSALRPRGFTIALLFAFALSILLQSNGWSEVFHLLAVMAAVGAYRLSMRRRQLRLNTASEVIAAQATEFALYLRPFVTSGAIRIRNSQGAIYRTLAGNRWDLELGLSFALSRIVPLIAIGDTASPDNSSWVTGMGQAADTM